jgi:hypothetical protein
MAYSAMEDWNCPANNTSDGLVVATLGVRRAVKVPELYKAVFVAVKFRSIPSTDIFIITVLSPNGGRLTGPELRMLLALNLELTTKVRKFAGWEGGQAQRASASSAASFARLQKPLNSHADSVRRSFEEN